MAIAKVVGQQVDAQQSGTTIVLTLNSVAAGNLLTIQCSYYTQDFSTVATLSDSNGGANWSIGIAPTPNLNTFAEHQATGIWYKQNCEAGTHTVTITSPFSTTSGHATMVEWSGAKTASVLDQTASTVTDNNTADTVVSGTTATLAATGDLSLVVVVVASSSSGSYNLTHPPTNYTALFRQDSQSASVGAEFASRILSSTTGEGVTWTWSPNTVGSMAVIATFQEAAGGGPGLMLQSQICM